MRALSFPELAFAVVSRYVSEEDIPHQDLKAIIDRSYSTFRSPGASCCVKLVLSLGCGPVCLWSGMYVKN